MKVCGIIAEYNPLHNGHVYQLEKARKETDADVLIVVMSGNFLQRGEPAIIDKWSRAQLALSVGADLVVELPVDYSVQPADYFAEGAVRILNALGVEVISFGSERGKSEPFKRAAEIYLENEQEINSMFKSQMKQSTHYAKNVSLVLDELFDEFPLDLSRPNNTLGFSYAKEIERNNYPIKLHTVKRLHSDYNEESLNPDVAIGSATAIRKTLTEDNHGWNQIKNYIPEETMHSLQVSRLVTWEDFFPYLRYQVSVQSLSALQSTYLMEDGLQYRIKEKIGEAATMTEFLQLLKTKQLTWTRLQRVCYHILMNNKKEDMSRRRNDISAVRLLGFSSNGQKYLNKNKSRFSIPLVSNVKKKQADMFYEDIRAGSIYRLAARGQIDHQDYYRKPINMIDK